MNIRHNKIGDGLRKELFVVNENMNNFNCANCNAGLYGFGI